MTYITWTIINWLSWTALATTWSTLNWFSGAFASFYDGIDRMVSIPLFLWCLFILWIWSIFISQSSK